MKEIKDLNYCALLNLKETQSAIKFVKDTFQKELEKRLNLKRISAPMFVLRSSGLNDGLNGVEEPINFSINGVNDQIEIVHSLAKWKRLALKKYNFQPGEGIYTDMNAIRKDENLDFYHSIYVDQWDWEKVITKEQRNLAYLKKTVKKIYQALLSLEKKVGKKYPVLNQELPKKIYFISTSELEKMYPNLTRKEREDAICRIHHAVFIYQIGWDLKDGLPHDGRAPDYDDWDLNGDLVLYYPLYDMAFEISSMGIRVNEYSLVAQLKKRNQMDKIDNFYCQSIINKQLPLTIGGGIGQSRLCMYMLKKAHIGEVQVSIWKDEDIKKLEESNIYLL